MRCPACQHENPPQAKFCLECGERLAARTRMPGVSPSLESYTPRYLAERILTSRSALEGERKQVTVLFADVVGFSTLAERFDAETVHALMDGCFEFLTRDVHRYEGTINQFTGDGIMALFGAPIAHEDHAVRALEAALDIQADVAEYAAAVERQWRVAFQMRIGINTGSVVVARIGDDLRMDYTAQGDTTNLAARLQQTAPAGVIWVAESTYRVAGGMFDWEPVGPVSVKGRESAVGVHRLTARRAFKSRFEAHTQRGLTPLVAREDELAQLLGAWQDARTGSGRIVSVVGEAGLGKSRLLYEFKQRLAREGGRYLEGSCFAYGGSISYLPFLQILKAYFGIDDHCPEPEAKQQVRAGLVTLPIDSSAVQAYLENLLSYAVEEEFFSRLPPHLVRERTVRALETLLVAAANATPLVLIIEDVHWIDKATEEVLAALVERVVDSPLLLLLVYRPEYLNAWATKPFHSRIDLAQLHRGGSAQMVRGILQKPYASRVALRRLNAEESTTLVQEVLGTPRIPQELEQLVVANTDGNPLFIEELTLSLIESGELVPARDGYVLQRALDAPGLPTTVQGVLLARIDRLGDELRDVLRAAAVIGRVFSYPVLASMLEAGPRLDRALLELEDLEFIFPIQSSPERRYSFKHVLTQQAVYDALLRPRRERLHERAGRAVEALYSERLEEHYELLAYHYGRSANAAKAVEYLDAANRKAIGVNAMIEARACFEAAAKQLDHLPADAANAHRRVALLVRQVNVFVLTFQMERFYELLTEHEPIAVGLEDRGLLGRFYACLGHCHWFFGRFDEALAVHAIGVRLSEEQRDWEGAAHHYMQMMWDHLCTGAFAAAAALAPEARRCLDGGFNLRWYVYALGGESMANTWLGRWQRAIEVGEEALRVVRQFEDNGAICFAGWILATAHAARGALDQAIDIAKMAVDKGPTPGDKAWAQCVLGWARARTGLAVEAVELLAPVVAMCREARFLGVPFSDLYLVESYRLAGRHQDALLAADETLRIAQRCRMQFIAAATYRQRAELAAAAHSLGQPGDSAAEDLDRAIEVLRDLGAENELALAHATKARLLKEQGAPQQAVACLHRALDTLQALGTLGEPDRVRAELAACQSLGVNPK
jgi:class 3 adenylate cyclase/tetratricopeptide (TPR) repeat protein